MITVDSPNLISVADAANLIPSRKPNTPVSIGTVHRWAKRGCRGIILDSIAIGGSRFTTREAISEFFAKLNAPEVA